MNYDYELVDVQIPKTVFRRIGSRLGKTSNNFTYFDILKDYEDNGRDEIELEQPVEISELLSYLKKDNG